MSKKTVEPATQTKTRRRQTDQTVSEVVQVKTKEGEWKDSTEFSEFHEAVKLFGDTVEPNGKEPDFLAARVIQRETVTSERIRIEETRLRQFKDSAETGPEEKRHE